MNATKTGLSNSKIGAWWTFYHAELLLFYFLLKRIKFWGREELTQSDSQAIANHLDGDKFWILTFPIENILDAGRRKGGDGSQFVNGNLTLTA